jgi:penicillin-binding protein 1A
MHPPPGPRDAVPNGRASPPSKLRVFALASAGLALLALLFAAAWTARVVARAPGPDAIRAALRVPQPSVLLSADGEHLATFRAERQQPVTLSRIAPAVVQALVAIEDRRFHEHAGIDVRRTLAAIAHTAVGDTQGGSTITQQLVRNLFPDRVGRERTIERKLKEMATALRLERLYSKREILQAYLNTAPFLYGVVGIEMAARTYFGKPAVDLDAAEAATLVGMLKGTHYYNPLRFPQRARERRNLVLAQMARHGAIDPQALPALQARPLGLHFALPADDSGLAPHFIVHVRRWLEAWARPRGIDIARDGLVIETTLDARLQRLALTAVERQAAALQDVADVEWSQPTAALLGESTTPYTRRRPKVEPFRMFWAQRPALLEAFVRESAAYRALRKRGLDDAAAVHRLTSDATFVAGLREAKTRLEAGMVAIDPVSGDIKAWVGSRDFARDQFDHVAQAQRQPGSTFKPMVYAAALQAGMPPGRPFVDAPVSVPLADGSWWRPTDMDGATGRTMTLYEGLVMSKNSVTVQAMQEVGVVDVMRVARSAGITRSPLDPVPSLALGTSPVTLLEMTSAYATIAALGEYRVPRMVRRITRRDGAVLAAFGTAPSRALPTEVAQDLIDMLRGAVNRGTGTAVRTRFGIKADVAGKTGTSQYNADGWFVLAHPQLVAGAWVGFNDQRVTLRSAYWGQGGHNALLLVGDFFRGALKERHLDPRAAFPPPRAPPPPIPLPQPGDEPWDLFPGAEQAGGAWHPSPDAGQAGILVARDADGRVLIGDKTGMAVMLQAAPAGP